MRGCGHLFALDFHHLGVVLQSFHLQAFHHFKQTGTAVAMQLTSFSASTARSSAAVSAALWASTERSSCTISC
jgi:hypothetical protein|eukprot:COSAG01_NODE_780_length_13660_cov_171.194233_12_plen_73_part_00